MLVGLFRRNMMMLPGFFIIVIEVKGQVRQWAPGEWTFE